MFNVAAQQQCLAMGIDPEQLKSLAIPVNVALANHHAHQMARHQQSLGAPLILGSRQFAGQPTTTSALLNGNQAMAAADGSTLLYTTASANPYIQHEFHSPHHQFAHLAHSPHIHFDLSAVAAASAAAAGNQVIDTSGGLFGS